MGIIKFLRLLLFKVGLIIDPIKYPFTYFSNNYCKLLSVKHCGQNTKQIRPNFYLYGVYQGHMTCGKANILWYRLYQGLKKKKVVQRKSLEDSEVAVITSD